MRREGEKGGMLQPVIWACEWQVPSVRAGGWPTWSNHHGPLPVGPGAKSYRPVGLPPSWRERERAGLGGAAGSSFGANKLGWARPESLLGAKILDLKRAQGVTAP